MIIQIDRSAAATALRIGRMRLFPDCVMWGGKDANWYYFGFDWVTPYVAQHCGRWGFDHTGD